MTMFDQYEEATAVDEEEEPNITITFHSVARDHVPEEGIKLNETEQFGRIQDALAEILEQDQKAVIMRTAPFLEVITPDTLVYPGDQIDVTVAVSNG